MKVKIFDEEHEIDLEDDINGFLKNDIQLHDIKFSSSCCNNENEQIFCFSALLMYVDKKEIHTSNRRCKMNKTKILCNVNSCEFYNNNECNADTISVSCDGCMVAKSNHETECNSFRCKHKR